MIRRAVEATEARSRGCNCVELSGNPIVAMRRAHGGCNSAADSWFRVVAVICCNPDFLLQSEKEGTPGFTRAAIKAMEDRDVPKDLKPDIP